MDTIVGLSSGRPPAAIAVIRTSGPGATRAAESLCGSLPPPRMASLRCLRHPADGRELDNALILSFPGPHSATGEDIVEYQCHGGRAVVSAVVEALTSIEGLRLAQPGEFTRRSLANGRIDLAQAEGLGDLLEAETEQQRRAALSVAGGALSRQVDEWQQRVLHLSAQAEAAIDYVDDEEETGTSVARLAHEARELAAELDNWLAKPRMEVLKSGVRVVVAGPPNAGKSSLVNALAGSERAIVTAIPGTTRDTIEVPLAVAGVPLVLVDTAGLRATSDPVEAIGVERAEAETLQADILLWLGAAANAPRHARLVLVASKADLEHATEEERAQPVSAVTGQNLDALISRIVTTAIALLPADGEIPLNKRQAATLVEVAGSLRSAPTDLLLLAESLRSARAALDRLTGRAGVEEALDALFSRFCLGK